MFLTGGRLAFVSRLALAATAAGIFFLGPSMAATLPETRVAVRSGDPAPVEARNPSEFGCGLTATADGGLLFADRVGSAIYRRDAGGEIGILIHAGDRVPGAPAIARLCETAASPDGAVVFWAILANRREAILRLPAAGEPIEVLLIGDATISLRGGPVTIARLSGPAVDGAGQVAVSVDFVESAAALLRIDPETPGTPEVLIQIGDPLGGGFFRRSPTAPGVAPDGTLAFTALLTSGAELLASLAPGGAPVTLFLPPVLPGQPRPTLAIAPPAINASGDVAVLWADRGLIRLQRIVAGLAQTIAEPGSPAPESGTFTEITDLPPLITDDGGVVFGAYRSNLLGGLYLHREAPVVVAQEEGDAGGGEIFATLDLSQPQPGPVVGSGGAILFAAADSQGAALYAHSLSGLEPLAHAGAPIQEAARFVTFLEASFPVLGGGPALAPGGRMIFDARITGGGRGLFLRDRDGGLTPASLHGDPAPGGGHLDGRFSSFHTVNDAGVFAFLGAAPDTSAGSSLVLYYGDARDSLRRVVGIGDAIPGSDSVVSGLLPPSRVNSSGAVAVPVVQLDGTVMLLGYDGSTLFRVAGPGDLLPGGGTVATILTGSSFANVFLPPLLDDGGIVTYGVVADDERNALYEAPLSADGGSAAIRLLGDGDPVEVGDLSPFEIQVFDRDLFGRLAFQSTFEEDLLFGTFLREDGLSRLLARRFDSVGDLGTVLLVRPRLAFAGEGRLVHGALLFGGADLLLLREPPTETTEEPVTSVLAATGAPSPDGGAFLAFQTGSRTTARLASDGAGLLALAAATTAGPEVILLYDLTPNAPPVGVAGPDQVVECAGWSGTAVTLDASDATDPDGDTLSYQWSGPFGSVTGAQPTVILPLGVATITLVVSDGELQSEPDTVVVEVRDTISPTLSVRAEPDLLWPPDGQLRPVFFPLAVSDRCDMSPSVTLESVAIDDARGSDPLADIAGAAYGTDDRTVSLRAKRSGGNGGRTYTVLYHATDASGNVTQDAPTVLVPSSQGK